MSRERCEWLYLLLGIVVAVGLLRPAPAAFGEGPLRDWTDINPATIGYKPVVMTRDAKTGFVVGGPNKTAVFRELVELNGRSIEALEQDMRPGARTAVGSVKGFIGADERLRDVLAADNQTVVDQLGLTHQELARHLHILAGIGAKYGDEPFLYHGRRFKVTGMDIAATGYQLSPFHDDTKANQEAQVHNLDNGKSLRYSLLVPHMIERYGFYEGPGTPYRVDPIAVVKVLDFLQPRAPRRKP